MLNIPAYTIQALVHEGTRTVLYRGYRDADRAPVVVKVVAGEYPLPEELARLSHEYQILKSISLPSIVKAHALEKYGNGLGLILEQLKGESLSELMAARRLDLPVILRIAVSLAETLGFLHQHGIIHRDVKPPNVFVDLNPLHVVLIDFGISTRLIAAAQRSTSPESLEGTLAYMSPEQTGRMNRSIDRRTDFYSMGVTLYEMLTGALPFYSSDPIEMVHNHIAKQPRAPHEVKSHVPVALSNLVMKLLEKAPENRYQSAYGLTADLQECLRQQEASHQIAVFPLGRHDRSEALHIPQKLYGRTTELAALFGGLERTAQGAAELLLVNGEVGIGKTALVQELSKTAALRGGYFASGKFAQFNRSVPYSAVAEALRELTQQVLITRSATLKKWREQLQAALGGNGGVLRELIPELALIIGPQPAVPTLGPVETQNRFNLVFQNFLHVFTTAEHPLVLFLDELQLADPASLKLLQTLLTDPERGHLLLIGAYRDSELGSGHPLPPAVKELREAGAVVTELKLGPLDLASATRLIEDAFSLPPAQAELLSQVVYEKTYGNPFFLGEFLLSLHSDKLLRFEESTARWIWDARAIAQQIVTTNVADLLIGKIQRLDAPSQRLLKEAACLGVQFDLKTLAAVHGQTPKETASELGKVVQEGLLLTLAPDNRLLDKKDRVRGDSEEIELNATYRFVHDRLHGTVYSLTTEAEKRELHLSIGRRLLLLSTASELDDALFGILHHLNLGAALVSDREERINFARLNLQAGRRAKASIAYQAACRFLEAGAALLDETDAEQEYELTFAMYIERAECESLDGHLSTAEALFSKLSALARSKLDRAYIYNVRITMCTLQGLYADGVRFGLAGLALFGITFPATPEEQQAAFLPALAEVSACLGERRIADLVDASVLTDPEQAVILKLMINFIGVSYLVSPGLYPLLTTKMLCTSLVHGNSGDSAYAYVTYGYMLATGMGRYEEGYEFGKLALALTEKFKAAHMACKVNLIFSNVMVYCQPLRTALSYAERAYQMGLAAGDFIYLSNACTNLVLWQLVLGDELGAVREAISRYQVLMQRTKDPLTMMLLSVTRQTVANLQGLTRGPLNLDDDTFNEVEFVANLERTQNPLGLIWYSILKLQLLFLYEDFEAARILLPVADARSEQLKGLNITTELPFFGSLTLLASVSAKSGLADPEQAAQLLRYTTQLATWAKHCPANFERKHLLVSAETARVHGRDSDAAVLYAQAIAQAHKDGAVGDEALATQLCAKFYLNRGRVKLASAYMTDAHYLYLRWGAKSKANHLALRYSQLVDLPKSAPPDEGMELTSTSGTRLLGGEALDNATVVRAANAIASEIKLDKVLDQLMRIVASNAGAQRGFLILNRNGRDGHEGALKVTASIDVESNVVQVDLRLPVEGSTDLALSVVQYVARTCMPVVLVDAAKEPRFANDPYIVDQKPKSLICLALQHRGRLTGVLYLENNSAPGVFTAERIELLRLLSSQAATAVENALLYGHVQQMSEQLQQNVAELRSANERLQVELSERARAEQERATLQNEIIQVQSARLAEMSTPLIPITEQIMVMPLIGTMDPQRAYQVMETALMGAQNNRAQVVIIDITGMKHVDTNVASALIKAASALRLLGAQAILTGIRAEVAQTLVSLGIDMSGIMTCGTLQSGIAQALRLSGISSLAVKAEPRNPASRQGKSGL